MGSPWFCAAGTGRAGIVQAAAYARTRRLPRQRGCKSCQLRETGAMPCPAPAAPRPAVTPMAFVRDGARLRAARAGPSAAARGTNHARCDRRAPTRASPPRRWRRSRAGDAAARRRGAWLVRAACPGAATACRAARRSPLPQRLASRCNAGAATTASVTEDIVLHLDRRRCAARLWIEERRDLGEMREICCATLLRYASASPAGDRLAHPAARGALPFAALRHLRRLPGDVPGAGALSHAARRPGVRRAAYTALPLRRDERALQAMLQRALPLTVLQYRRDRLFAQRVREALHADNGGSGRCDRGGGGAERCQCARCTASCATRGCSLQQLRDEARRTCATELWNAAASRSSRSRRRWDSATRRFCAGVRAGWPGWRRLRGGEGAWR